MVALSNCVKELSDKIQCQEKSAKSPVILGFRLIDGPWDKTKFLDVETQDKQYSALLIQEDGNNILKMVAPFKVTLKEKLKK